MTVDHPHPHGNPRSLDLRSLADAGVALEGRTHLTELARLHTPDEPAPALDAQVSWHANAQWRPVRAAPPELWLHLRAHATLERTCQRCLQGVALHLSVDRSFRMVASEQEAQALDNELEDDVLVLTRPFNLIELVEDEVLLALPLVPRHEACPQPLQAPRATGDATSVDATSDTAHPFAALAALKQRPQ